MANDTVSEQPERAKPPYPPGSPEDLAAHTERRRKARHVLRFDFREVTEHLDVIDDAVHEILVSTADDDNSDDERRAIARVSQAAFMIRGIVPDEDEPEPEAGDSQEAADVDATDAEPDEFAGVRATLDKLEKTILYAIGSTECRGTLDANLGLAARTVLELRSRFQMLEASR